jgi:hypothetical protein
MHRKILSAHAVLTFELHKSIEPEQRLFGSVTVFQNLYKQDFKNQSLMLCEETIAVCSEIHKRHVNKAESYYRLRPYRAENTVLCIYVSWYLVAVCGTPTFS